MTSKGIEYAYIDIGSVPDSIVTVQQLNGGLSRIPTIIFADGTVLVEPSNVALQAALDKHPV